MTTTPKHRFPWILLAMLLALDVVVWLAEKKGVGLSEAGDWGFARNVVAQPLIWLAVGMGPVQLWLWTLILRRSDLSLAYPLTSLAYPLTMIAAWGVFGEHVSWLVWLGALLITFGVAVMGSHEPSASGGEVL